MLQITALHTPRQIIVPQDKEKLPYTLDTKTHNTLHSRQTFARNK